MAGAIDSYIPPGSVEEQWDVPGSGKTTGGRVCHQLPLQQWLEEDNKLHEEALREKIMTAVAGAYDTKAAAVGDDMRKIEKQIMLQILDTLWKEHLATMDHLRQGIHLRAYAQKNPKQEYKRESFELFEQLLDNLKYEVVKFLSHVQIQSPDEAAAIEQQRRRSGARASWLFSMRRPLRWSRRQRAPGEPRSRRSRRPLPGSSPRSVATSPAPVAVARSTSSVAANFRPIAG